MGLIDTSPINRQTVFDMLALTRPDRRSYGLFGLRSNGQTHILKYAMRNVLEDRQIEKSDSHSEIQMDRLYIKRCMDRR